MPRGARSVKAITVAIVVTLVVLSSTLLNTSVTPPGVGSSRLTIGPGTGTSAGGRGPWHALASDNPLPSNPANCTQGSRKITVSPAGKNMEPTLLQDYQALGQAGGGTLVLGPGVFYLNETLNLQRYSNVSIQGSGMGRTVVSVPLSPIGNYTSDNGTPVGLYNTSSGGAVNGTAVNLLQISGGTPINNFELCDLTIDAQASNASEDWAGSLIMDISGGIHHVYSDITEVGFFGPSTTPNGLHLESSGTPGNIGVGYVVDHLEASNYSVPYEYYPGFRGGPNFLNVGAVVSCTLDDVSGIGLAAFEVAPPRGCLFENWNVSGHILIDPSMGGTWGNSLFQNVTDIANGTPAPNALDIDVANGTSNGGSNFTALRWNDSRFVGTVLDAANMVDVENTTFQGGVNSTAAVFERNLVVWNPNASENPVPLPIRADGVPAGGSSSLLSGNTFIFPNGTGKNDPFLLTVPKVAWFNNTLELSGVTTGYWLSAPKIGIATYSCFCGLTYDSLGNNSPPDLVLLDIVGSPGFEDLGAVVGPLTRVYNDLPVEIPSAPTGLGGSAENSTAVNLSWAASLGPVTNYTVLVGGNGSSWGPDYSAGLATHYLVTGLSADTLYRFSVEAWNLSLHSPLASTIEVSTPRSPDYAPGVPTELTVTSLGSSQVDLRWNPSTGNVTNYTVYTGTSRATLSSRYSVGASTTFNVTGLAPSTTYFIAVEAWNFSWRSGPSEPLNVTTLPAQNLPGSGPADWAGILGTMAGVFGAVVAAFVVVSLLRTRSRGRKPDRRRIQN